MPRIIAIAILLFVLSSVHAQPKDTVYLMNGQIVASTVTDSTFGSVTIVHPRKAHRKIHYEWDQLYMVRFANNGKKRYYYSQDSTIGNWFTRQEMWMYMKGERDARNGFRGNGSLFFGTLAGLGGGVTGLIYAPIAPYGFMMLTGIPRVRIRHSTVSDPRNLDSDAYILGYERVARQKRKIKAVVGGTIGLVVGYAIYFGFHDRYPEEFDLGR
jgi:hypothetical protein